MFLGVDFEFAKIRKGGRRAKLDSELLSSSATFGKDRLQAVLPVVENFRLPVCVRGEVRECTARPLRSSVG
jgi:hypothetical protein